MAIPIPSGRCGFLLAAAGTLCIRISIRSRGRRAATAGAHRGRYPRSAARHHERPFDPARLGRSADIGVSEVVAGTS